MIKNYSKKDIKKTPTKDGQIFQEDGIWKFYHNGNICGYLSKEDAKAGLKKLSGTVEKEA
tara:strand:- start:60 stop:239 length:180 start_codon:yes stop_codon:yes gene_type:complete